MENEVEVQKVIIVGDEQVGKTTLVKQAFTGIFNGNYIMTIGVDHYTKDFKVRDDGVSLVVWDIAGQERFSFLRPDFYKGARIGIVAFDLTRMDTFKHLDSWYEEINHAVGDIPTLLVGTKADLKERRVVGKRKAIDYANERNVDYFETSANDNQNVEALFLRVTHLALYESHNRKVPKSLKNYTKLYQTEILPKLTGGYQFSSLLFK